MTSDPAFGVLTIDGLGWIDPYTGVVVPSPRGHLATARDHLMRTRPWLAASPKPLAELHLLRWLHFLVAAVKNDGRLRGFRRDSNQWMNPFTGNWHHLELDGGRLDRKGLRAMAEILVRCPEAQSGRMLDAGRLTEMAMGLPAAPASGTGAAAKAVRSVGIAGSDAKQLVSATAVVDAIVETEEIDALAVRTELDFDLMVTPLPFAVSASHPPAKPRSPTPSSRMPAVTEDLLDRITTPLPGGDPSVETDPIGTVVVEADAAVASPRRRAPAPLRPASDEVFESFPTPMPGGDPSVETDASGRVVAEAIAAFATRSSRAELPLLPGIAGAPPASELRALERLNVPLAQQSAASAPGVDPAEEEAEDLAAWLDQVSTTAVHRRSGKRTRASGTEPFTASLSAALEPRRPAAAAVVAGEVIHDGTTTADFEPHVDPRHVTTTTVAKAAKSLPAVAASSMPAIARTQPITARAAVVAPAVTRAQPTMAVPAPSTVPVPVGATNLAPARPARAIIESSAEIIAIMPLDAPAVEPVASAEAELPDCEPTVIVAVPSPVVIAPATPAILPPSVAAVSRPPAVTVPMHATVPPAPTPAADVAPVAPATIVAQGLPSSSPQPLPRPPAPARTDSAPAVGVSPDLHRSLLARAHAAADALYSKALGGVRPMPTTAEPEQRQRRTLARLRGGAPAIPGHALAMQIGRDGFAEVLRRDDGRWLIATGQVAGPGPVTPLLIAALKALHVVADNGSELNAFASDLADCLIRELADGRTLALSLVLYDIDSGRIECLGAGLPPVLVASRRRRAAVQQPGQAGPALGAVSSDELRTRLRPARFQLTGGDILVQIAANLDDALLLHLMAGLVANLDSEVPDLPRRLTATAGRLGDAPLPEVTILALSAS